MTSMLRHLPHARFRFRALGEHIDLPLWSVAAAPAAAMAILRLPPERALTLTVVLGVSVLAHELGHALAARAVGSQTGGIWITPFAGACFVDEETTPPLRRTVTAAAGPAVNAAIAATAFHLAAPLSAHLTPRIVSRVDHSALTHALLEADATVRMIAYLNLFLAAVNLLPLPMLDGGRIVTELTTAVRPSAARTVAAASTAGVVALAGSGATVAGVPVWFVAGEYVVLAGVLCAWSHSGPIRNGLRFVAGTYVSAGRSISRTFTGAVRCTGPACGSVRVVEPHAPQAAIVTDS